MVAPLGRIRAVVRGEMRSLARQRTPFVMRTIYGALVAAVVLLAIGGATASPGTFSSGQMLAIRAYGAFSAVASGQMLLAALLGAIVGVVSAHGERQNRTLGLLVLSQLRPGEVILGKLAALLGLVASILIAGVPVFAILGWAGGLDYRWLGWLAALTLAAAAQGIATGLALGFRWRSALGAAFTSLLLMVAPIVLAWGFGYDRLDDFHIGLLASVGLAMNAIAEQSQETEALADIKLGIAVALGWTAAMVAVGCDALPRAAAAGAGRGLRGVFEKLDRGFEAINIGGIRLGSGRTRGPRGNPVAWLESLNAGLGLPQYGLRLLTAALVLSSWSLVLVIDGGRWAAPVTFFWGGALILVALAAGASAFGEERARHCLPVLLATPLTGRLILRGKLLTSLRLLFVTALPIALILMVYDSLYGFRGWQAQEFLVYCLAGPVCGYLLARHMSLVMTSTLRAGIAGAVLLVALLLFFGLLQAFDSLHPAVPLAVALLIDRFSVFTFDRTLGRST